ncbi:MAG: rhodanese-like domain-containing protein [Woeseiaceae bacterium]|nr:rhodanese-like domain-containing protein [Woeseiaceae bacterium]
MLTNPSDLVAKAKATIHECEVGDAHGCLQTDTLIIDIREPAEYQRGHIPGALHLPRGLLEFEIHGLVERASIDQNKAPEEQDIILYCGTGGRSALAAATMAELGYRNVRSMMGGVVAWNAAGLPLDTPG